MIKLKGEFKEGLFIPERDLTANELKGITSTLTNGADNTITYFYGDEPKSEGGEVTESNVNLIDILSNASAEEIEFIKQLLK